MMSVPPLSEGFQFLGIPPKGEHTVFTYRDKSIFKFPISRDPPEGGTVLVGKLVVSYEIPFPISRDPPEGGTSSFSSRSKLQRNRRFQFLGIPPKGERAAVVAGYCRRRAAVSNF